ncbi:hypothetical protein HA402_015519 [Bradysia odoriphaga]|nr:hypothetical protein HA402_015519 [Bradysia odoriphaga]
MKTILVIFAAICVLCTYAGAQGGPLRAVAVLTGNVIRGTIYFTQTRVGEPVLVQVDVTGLTANQGHGFHIHETGDLTRGCASLLGHYDPHTLNHGGPRDHVRHVGDLGNIQADSNGISRYTFSDNLISLSGAGSIIGRGVIVHQDVDDLGRGGHPDSLTTGNAGARAACGVVGIV